jgi:predicted DNA-binding ribbon-helix-helix protein
MSQARRNSLRWQFARRMCPLCNNIVTIRSRKTDKRCPVTGENGRMKSLIAKRSVIVKKRKTSVTLEDDFWQALNEIARLRRVSLSRLITSIDAEQLANLSSSIRLFVLRFFKEGEARRYPTHEAAE